MNRVIVLSLTLVGAVSAQAQDLTQSFFRGVWSGQTAAVRSLLDTGRVDVNTTANDGTTPLIIAASTGDQDMVEVLVEAGADPKLANDDVETPLLFAAMYGMNSVAANLIEAGADANAQDSLGRTPWTWAAWGNNESLQSLLKNSGADGSGAADPFADGTPVTRFETRPDLKKGSAPEISKELRAGGVNGSIQLLVVLEQNGKVRSVELTEGLHEELDRDVLDEVPKWRFEPAEIQGKAVPAQIGLQIDYPAGGERRGHVIMRSRLLASKK